MPTDHIDITSSPRFKILHKVYKNAVAYVTHLFKKNSDMFTQAQKRVLPQYDDFRGIFWLVISLFTNHHFLCILTSLNHTLSIQNRYVCKLRVSIN